MSSSAKADDPVFQSASSYLECLRLLDTPLSRAMTTVVVSRAPPTPYRNPMADSDDVPFNRDFPLQPGVADEVRPGVRRILCNNPSPFTFTGTVSYIVGRGKVAIIDPGPDNEIHASALLDAVRGETVTHILVTHTHRDHSPNTARIKAATGATVYAEGPHRASRPSYESEQRSSESGADRDFKPDIAVRDGEIIEGAGWALQAVATPGHTANHIAFSWQNPKTIVLRDHLIGWSTPR